MSDHFCDRCGDYLHEGSLKYTVHIQIISDFDGVIFLEEDEHEDASRCSYRGSEDKNDKEADEEVYQELSFNLCPKCRQRFARDPFNRGARLLRPSRNFERLFH